MSSSDTPEPTAEHWTWTPGTMGYLHTPHQEGATFPGERCTECGINYYDWLAYGDDETDPKDIPPNPAVVRAARNALAYLADPTEP